MADPPAIYRASFSTGAIDINNVLAGFSSRGRAPITRRTCSNPEISAPGVSVRSCYLFGYDLRHPFGDLNGRAARRRRGGLLWSARPRWRDIADKGDPASSATVVTVSPAQTCEAPVVHNSEAILSATDASRARKRVKPLPSDPDAAATPAGATATTPDRPRRPRRNADTDTDADADEHEDSDADADKHADRDPTSLVSTSTQRKRDTDGDGDAGEHEDGDVDQVSSNTPTTPGRRRTTRGHARLERRRTPGLRPGRRLHEHAHEHAGSHADPDRDADPASVTTATRRPSRSWCRL